MSPPPRRTWVQIPAQLTPVHIGFVFYPHKACLNGIVCCSMEVLLPNPGKLLLQESWCPCPVLVPLYSPAQGCSAHPHQLPTPSKSLLPQMAILFPELSQGQHSGLEPPTQRGGHVFQDTLHQAAMSHRKLTEFPSALSGVSSRSCPGYLHPQPGRTGAILYLC